MPSPRVRGSQEDRGPGGWIWTFISGLAGFKARLSPQPLAWSPEEVQSVPAGFLAPRPVEAVRETSGLSLVVRAWPGSPASGLRDPRGGKRTPGRKIPLPSLRPPKRRFASLSFPPVKAK